MRAINSKKLDELYKEWSGEHHTINSGRPIHDSAECTDFAEYCLKYAFKEYKDTEITEAKEKNKQANEFIKDMAEAIGMDMDGIGYDELTISIEDVESYMSEMGWIVADNKQDKEEKK